MVAIKDPNKCLAISLNECDAISNGLSSFLKQSIGFGLVSPLLSLTWSVRGTKAIGFQRQSPISQLTLRA